ncbi:MAG: hypothetical protein WAW88_09995 [Nocardioides sp.]
MDARAWTSRALNRGLRQPDSRSCGAAALVVARMLNDERYAELIATGRHPLTGYHLDGAPAERFSAEVIAMHRRSTRSVALNGRLQLPWPRLLGTPPWALAAQMSGQHGSGRGGRYRARWILPSRRDDVVPAIAEALDDGEVVPLMIGTRWLPRHVVLITGRGHGATHDQFGVYDPAAGGIRRFAVHDFVSGRLGLGRWQTPWAVVLPD